MDSFLSPENDHLNDFFSLTDPYQFLNGDFPMLIDDDNRLGFDYLNGNVEKTQSSPLQTSTTSFLPQYDEGITSDNDDDQLFSSDLLSSFMNNNKTHHLDYLFNTSTSPVHEEFHQPPEEEEPPLSPFQIFTSKCVLPPKETSLFDDHQPFSGNHQLFSNNNLPENVPNNPGPELGLRDDQNIQSPEMVMTSEPPPPPLFQTAPSTVLSNQEDMSSSSINHPQLFSNQNYLNYPSDQMVVISEPPPPIPKTYQPKHQKVNDFASLMGGTTTITTTTVNRQLAAIVPDDHVDDTRADDEKKMILNNVPLRAIAPRRKKKRATKEELLAMANTMKRDGIIRPAWLPEDWVIERRKRVNGMTKGVVDQYYYHLKTGKQYRSKIEVLFEVYDEVKIKKLYDIMKRDPDAAILRPIVMRWTRAISKSFLSRIKAIDSRRDQQQQQQQQGRLNAA